MEGKKFFDFWVDDETAVGVVGVLLVEILMVIFGGKEIGKGNDLGHDWVGIVVGFFKFSLDSLSDFFLM